MFTTARQHSYAPCLFKNIEAMFCVMQNPPLSSSTTVIKIHQSEGSSRCILRVLFVMFIVAKQLKKGSQSLSSISESMVQNCVYPSNSLP